MRAKKSLGQNFLRDQNLIDRIVDALELTGDETVIEIGPGHGALTERLVEKAAQVIAIEFDRDLIQVLKYKFSHHANFTVINEDALKVDFSRLISQNFKSEISNLKLAANLPYNISTPILQRLIDQRHLFNRIVLMFQREVVERITAKPGSSNRGYLSVLVEKAFETEYLFEVPPQAFFPVPKVWSAVVSLRPKESAVLDEAAFRKVVSVSFSQKRKTLFNNLKTEFENAAALLESSNIDGNRRAETLTIAEWVNLTKATAECRDDIRPCK
ncbi:MAG: 16S rRNA (adenine(1518)-N(6)/adenine(1519)-N(6))-dimethyltransferase RsmA [Pyrinomonadaceae bacterium]